MKKAISLLMLFGMLILSAAPVAAQTYEGTNLGEGIFYVPADPGPGSIINFAASGLAPDSEVSFILSGPDQNEIDGLEVAGALVLRADGSGNINADIRIPATVDVGVLTLRVEATKSDNSPFVAELAIDVSADAVANPGGTDVQPSDLAFTGSDSSTTILGAVFLVAAGLALVAVASQRRSAPSDA